MKLTVCFKLTGVQMAVLLTDSGGTNGVLLADTGGFGVIC